MTGKAPRRYLAQRLKLHHLRAVEAILAQRSLLKAASVIGVSQPALTKTLRELEEVLGQRLFDRLPRGVRATEAGTLVAGAAARIMAELARLDEGLDRLLDPEGGVVALGTLPVAATGVLPVALTRLKAGYPGIGVRLDQGRTEELLPKLAAGEIDLIVGRLYDPPAPDGFLREPLWEEPISLLARTGHPVLEGGPPDLAALRRHELILPTVSQRVGGDIEGVLALLGLSPTPSLRSSSYGFIREMLHATDLIAVMPRLMMAGDLLRGTLCVVPLPVPAPPRPAGLILPRDRALSPAGQAFVACLRGCVAEIGERGLADITAADRSAGKSDRTARGARR